MRWRGRRTSKNILDVRRSGGGGGGMRLGGPGLRIGGIGMVIVVVLGLIFGVDIGPLLGMVGGGGGGYSAPSPSASGPNTIDDEPEEFVGVVLADTEEVWSSIFAENDMRYEEPQLVLFSGQVQSACGFAGTAMGPFYCPGDRRAYLDTSFFRTMKEQLGAKGDFAAAYVIAHEIAHHVQNLTGRLPQVNAQRQRVSVRESNLLSVRIELQADCYSGVWARRAERRFGSIEQGDIEEALNAASRIGDDVLQRRAGRAVVPDSFQHGSSAQRVRWFRTGYESGDPGQCDTFATDQL